MPGKIDSEDRIAQWVAEEWGRHFAIVLESMADLRPSTHCEAAPTLFLAEEGAINFEQEFNLGTDCSIRISVPEIIWYDAGSRVLRAAGILEVSREDSLSTFHEILNQTFAGVAQALSTRLGRDVSCAARSEPPGFPEDTVGLPVSIGFAETQSAAHPVFVSTTSQLIERLGETKKPAQSGAADPDEQPWAMPLAQPVAPAAGSKTFELLLAVSLPVSVSFGKTSMMVKEVLKLTTGSIVELNRAVSEPVDIIVNNCVIARGEVVVVGGNYGVRVREIVSREQRYETSVQSVARTN